MPKIHRLKTWPEYYKAMQENRKPFELRLNDRDFQEGDQLILEEWVPCEHCGMEGSIVAVVGECCGRPLDEEQECPECKGKKGKYTGRGITRYVTYIMEGLFGLLPGWVVMGISRNRV